LVHPTLAKIVVGATKAIAESVYHRISDMKFDYSKVASSKFLSGLHLGPRSAMLEVINRAKPAGVTRDHLTVWRKQIRELPKFDEYSAELNALIALVGADPTLVKRHLNLNLRSGWCAGERFLDGIENKKVNEALEAVAAK
jgi:hypothetical protein